MVHRIGTVRAVVVVVVVVRHRTVSARARRASALELDLEGGWGLDGAMRVVVVVRGIVRSGEVAVVV